MSSEIRSTQGSAAKSGKRRILFLTGTRADFGKLKPLIAEVENSSEFEAVVFATGMHLLSRYGSTLVEIQRAGFKNIFSFLNQDSQSTIGLDMLLANTVQGLGHYVREFAPDLIVVHGDRVEAMAGAVVGTFNNILVAHIEGGERSGTVDEIIRHTVTKLSHIHYVANQEARHRLLQLGESDRSIFVIGSPDIDVMLSDQLPELSEVRERYAIPFQDYGILIYHPVTTELQYLRQRTEELVAAVKASGWNFVVIYPNNDPGTETILDAYQGLRENERFRLLPSMRFEYFLALLKNARACVGNSSAGIREAPVYGVPTLNIGSRQAARSEDPTIVHVEDRGGEILAALETLPRRVPASQLFGTGDSAAQFMRSIRSAAVWQTPVQKQFCDLREWPPAPADA